MVSFILVSMMWLMILFVCLTALKLSSGEENIELEIAQGKLNGLKNITVYHGIPFYSFRGIPYAKPNVGRDRFNVAVPLESWSGVLNATRHGNNCAHILGKKAIGHEDCLFLNVYTPDLNQTAKKAVMVFFHGGGFFFGSGDDILYGPDFLVEKDVLLVTVNYRLGVIGFLNTGDINAPGNNGLKDQNLALKWVQKNIINFGGDPERVTIFGESAGAASVHYHMMSPMSKGLFKGAVLQSGAAICPWAFSSTPKDNAMALAKSLKINVTDMAELVEKLKNESTENLLMASQNNTILKHFGVFVPSVEDNVGQDVFLPDNPWKMLTTDEITDVPVVIGVTENEFGFLALKLVSPLPEYRDSLDDLIPHHLNITDQAHRDSVTQSFEKFYFNGLPITTDPLGGAKLYSDLFISYGTLISAGIMSERMSSSVYKYLFNYNTPSSIMKRLIPVARGVVHCDDLGLLFYSTFLNNLPKPDSLEEQKINEMVELWTNFAKEGDPSVAMGAAKIKWEPMGNDEKYLDIGNALEMKNSLFKERIAFWANLYSNVLGDFVKLFK